jgi:hypothetical protein
MSPHSTKQSSQNNIGVVAFIYSLQQQQQLATAASSGNW